MITGSCSLTYTYAHTLTKQKFQFTLSFKANEKEKADLQDTWAPSPQFVCCRLEAQFSAVLSVTVLADTSPSERRNLLTNEAVCAIFKIGMIGLLLHVMKLLAAWDNKCKRCHETRNSVLFSLNQHCRKKKNKHKTWEKCQHWHTRHRNGWAR